MNIVEQANLPKLHPNAKAVLQHLLRQWNQPQLSASRRAIARGLGVSEMNVYYHIRQLVKRGLLMQNQVGVCYLTEQGLAVAQALTQYYFEGLTE